MAELALPDMGPVFLGGRQFRVAQETTARQDDWVLCATADAGLEELARDVDGSDREQAITLAAFRSGCADRILAGVLVEDGVPWSAESAETNAKAFGALTHAIDKTTRRRVLVAALARFFWPALVSPPSSPKSSEIPGGNTTGETSADSPAIDPAGASASGAMSSAPSADTIRS